MSTGVGLAIEVWKLRKAIKSLSIHRPVGALFPRILLVPTDSYALSDTKVEGKTASLTARTAHTCTRDTSHKQRFTRARPPFVSAME